MIRRLSHAAASCVGSAVCRIAQRRVGRRSLLLRRCLIAAFACLSFPANSVAAERAVDLELVLAADISGSMDLQEAVLQREGFVSAFRHPEVVEAIQGGRLGRIAVTYIEWAGVYHQSTLVDWTEVADATSAAAFAEAMARPDVMTELWTSISTLIAYAARRFEGNGFQGQRRVIDISGDGPNNKGAYIVDARDRALASGIVINGLPIINGRPGRYGYPPLPNLDLYYEDCVIGGPGAFVIVADGYEDFARAIRRKLVMEIAGRVPPVHPVRLASDRHRPPCNAGEMQLQNWHPDYDEF